MFKNRSVLVSLVKTPAKHKTADAPENPKPILSPEDKEIITDLMKCATKLVIVMVGTSLAIDLACQIIIKTCDSLDKG